MSWRYVIAGILLISTAALLGALAGSIIPGVTALRLAIIAAVLYPIGVLLDLLPPGRPRDEQPGSDSGEEALRPAPLDYAQRRREVREQRAQSSGSAARRQFDHEAASDAQRGGPARVLVALGVAGAFITAVAVAAFAARLGDTLLRADPDDPLGATPVAAPSATGESSPAAAPETASPAVTSTGQATATAERPSPTPSLTPTPTSTPTRTPPPATPTATPTVPLATPTPAVAALPAGWATGTWQISDTVTFGPSQGQTFVFVVTLVEQDGSITGEGDGLLLAGRRDGNSVSLSFARRGATGGYFAWTVQPDGSMAGEFEDYSAGNGGSSVASRAG